MIRWGLLLVLLAAACRPAPKPSFINWHDSSTVDSVTGKEIVAIWTPANAPYSYNGMDTSKAGQDFRPVLWIRCRDQELELYVELGAFIALGADEALTYSFDRDQLENTSFPLSENHTALFLPSSPQWMLKLSQSTQLQIWWRQDNPYKTEFNQATAAFDLTGFDQVVQPVLDACRIKKALTPTASAWVADLPQNNYGPWRFSSSPRQGVTVIENSVDIPSVDTEGSVIHLGLSVRCRYGTLDAYFKTSFIIPEPEIKLTYRFDEHPIRTGQFRVSEDHTTIILENTSEWIQSLSMSQRLLVAWPSHDPDNGVPYEAEFSIGMSDFNFALKRVRYVCTPPRLKP